MKLKKRLLAAAAAACMLATSLPAYSMTASAASYNAKTIVDYNMFYVDGVRNSKVIAAIERQTGKDYDETTYGDLEKVTTLNLSNMGLDGVPEVVKYMFRLKNLDLSDNLLKNSDVSSLDFSSFYNLETIDISNNYLTYVPSWYAALNDEVKNRDISGNLIDMEDQRAIVISPTTYYFMRGEKFDENEFKDKVLSTMKLSDGTMLPDFFYDPSLPTYDISKEDEKNDNVKKNHNVIVEFDVSKFVKDGVVTATGHTDAKVGLLTAYENANTTVIFKMYFLDENDPSTLRMRLKSLISECTTLDKTNYTANSWAAFEAARKTADAIAAYDGADADMLTNALSSLNNAKANLIMGVSASTKTILNSLISIAKTYVESDYSEASWRKFSKAVTALQDAVESTETSIEAANAAIKEFQQAQTELSASLMIKPEKILKSQFESIYGEDKIVSAKGTTRLGYRYSWEFNGNDVTLPADFDPEIIYDSSYEELIRFEVGSASDYHLFRFAETKKFPGTAVVTLDVSAVYDEGTYRLYKWNSSAKKSEFIKEVEIYDGTVSFTVSEGGDYFISSVLQNFQMISSNFDINNDKLTISCTFKKKYTVADFRSSIENGDAVTILTAEGEPVLNSDNIATGMTACAAGSEVAYTIIMPGDCDGDGNASMYDALATLKAAMGDETVMPTYAQKLAADVTKDGWVRMDDALEILKYALGTD
ncbi:MAG: hypothetical protein IJO91_09925 [Oscillospiraceae bacterium]|nr:hypothetical protein [Oscillospiraceae bacterium]